MKPVTREEYLCSLLELMGEGVCISETRLETAIALLRGWRNASKCYAAVRALSLCGSGSKPPLTFKPSEATPYELPPSDRPDLALACLIVNTAKRSAGPNFPLATAMMEEPEIASMPDLRHRIVSQVALFEGESDNSKLVAFCDKLGQRFSCFCQEIGVAIGKSARWEGEGNLGGLLRVVREQFSTLIPEQQLAMAEAMTKYVTLPVLQLADVICVPATAKISGRVLGHLLSLLEWDKQIKARKEQDWHGNIVLHQAAQLLARNGTKTVSAFVSKLDPEAMGQFMDELVVYGSLGGFGASSCDCSGAYAEFGRLLAKRVGKSGAKYAPFVGKHLVQKDANAHLVVPLALALGPENIREDLQSWLSGYRIPADNRQTLPEYNAVATRDMVMDRLAIPFGFHAHWPTMHCLGHMVRRGYSLTEKDIATAYLSNWIGRGENTYWHPNPEVWENKELRAQLFLKGQLSREEETKAAVVGWLLDSAYSVAKKADLAKSYAWFAQILPTWPETPEWVRLQIICATGQQGRPSLARYIVTERFGYLNAKEREEAKAVVTTSLAYRLKNIPDYVRMVFGEDDLLTILFETNPGKQFLGDIDILAPLFEKEEAQARLLGWLESNAFGVNLHHLVGWLNRYPLLSQSVGLQGKLRVRLLQGCDFSEEEALERLLKPFQSS